MVARAKSEGPYYVGETITFRWRTGIQSTKLLKPAAEGALTITVGDTTGYADTNVIVINPGHPSEREETRTITGTPTEHVITLTTALAFAHGVGEVVGEVATPTATLTITLPDGTSSTPSVTSSAGTHTATLTTTQAGQHKVQWRGTGNGAGELEYTVEVLTNLIV